jgi:hypothetical protein
MYSNVKFKKIANPIWIQEKYPTSSHTTDLTSNSLVSLCSPWRRAALPGAVGARWRQQLQRGAPARGCTAAGAWWRQQLQRRVVAAARGCRRAASEAPLLGAAGNRRWQHQRRPSQGQQVSGGGGFRVAPARGCRRRQQLSSPAWGGEWRRKYTRVDWTFALPNLALG